MRFRTLVTMLLTVTTFISISHAHPGRTDSKGGHTNHSTGEYHYHHGYPAHQHTNGECPYDFDDRTGWNSGSGSSGGSLSSSSSSSSGSSDSGSSSIVNSSGDARKPDSVLFGVIIMLLFILVPVLDEGAFRLWKQVNAVRLRYGFETKKEREHRLKQEAEEIRLRIEEEERQAELQAKRLAQEQNLKEMRRKLELRREEERRQQEQQYEEARAFALNYYAGKTTKECAGMPDRFEMGTDRLPREIGSARWGSTFTFYTSPSGRSYHCKRGCSSAKLPIHAYHCAKSKNPCKRCNPVLPDMSWYDRYWVVVEDKKKFGIPDFVPPSEETKEENGVERL